MAAYPQLQLFPDFQWRSYIPMVWVSVRVHTPNQPSLTYSCQRPTTLVQLALPAAGTRECLGHRWAQPGVVFCPALLPAAACGTSHRAFPPQAGRCTSPQSAFKVVWSLFESGDIRTLYFWGRCAHLRADGLQWQEPGCGRLPSLPPVLLSKASPNWFTAPSECLGWN